MAEPKAPKKTGQGKSSKNKARWRYPETVNIDYQTLLYQDLDGWFDTINKALNSSDTPFTFQQQIPLLLDTSSTFGAAAINSLADMFKQVAVINEGYWQKMVMEGAGKTLAPAEVMYAPGDAVIIGDTSGIDVYRAEPWLKEMQSTWVQDNTSLIKSIPPQHLDDVANLTQQAVEEGWRIETLTKKIQDRYHIPENRAALIATDQVGKANSAVSMQRMRDYGIRKYRWRGALDARERKVHYFREGQEFDIDHPPDDGPPGYPIRCRCWPEPVWDEAA